MSFVTDGVGPVLVVTGHTPERHEALRREQFLRAEIVDAGFEAELGRPVRHGPDDGVLNQQLGDAVVAVLRHHGD